MTQIYIIGLYDPEVTDGPRYIKVGLSTVYENRLATLQGASPFELRTIDVMEFADIGMPVHTIEKRLHYFLRDYRVRGEWFEAGALEKIKDFDPGKIVLPSQAPRPKRSFPPFLARAYDLLDLPVPEEPPASPQEINIQRRKLREIAEARIKAGQDVNPNLFTLFGFRGLRGG